MGDARRSNDLVVGPDGLGATALTWPAVVVLLEQLIGCRIAQEVDAPVEVMGLRMVTADGLEVDTDGFTLIAGFTKELP